MALDDAPDRHGRRNYVLLSIFLFGYFFGQAMAMSLLSIWFTRRLGLTGAQAGLVFSANFIAAMGAQPLYGFISDKVGFRKHVLWAVAALVACCGPFFVFIYGPLLRSNLLLGAVVGGVYIGVTFIAGSYAVEAYTNRVGRKCGFEYSRARFWGSLGFATAALFSGQLYNINPAINFMMASGAALVLFGVLALTRIDATPEEVKSASSLKVKDTLAILAMPKFWGFMVLILGVTDLYLIYDQQFPAYFASQFATPQLGARMFGYLNSVQIFVEAGGMLVAPFFVKRLGAKRGLMLAGSIMIVRIGGSGLAVGPVAISCMKMLHSLELPILMVSVFRYIAFHFEQRLGATLYMVGFSFGHSIGLAVLSPLAGRSYDLIGFPATYFAIAGCAAIFLALSAFTLSPTPPEHGRQDDRLVPPGAPNPDLAAAAAP